MNKIGCPFCGSKDVSVQIDVGFSECIVRCDSCRASGPPRPAIEDAIDEWNKRAFVGFSPRQLQGVVLDLATKVKP